MHTDNQKSADDAAFERVMDIIVRRVLQTSDVPSKTRGRPSNRNKQLRVDALLDLARLVSSDYHWDPDAVVRRVLRENPDLIPQQRRQDKSPLRAIRSAYRKSVSGRKKREKTRQVSLRNDWNTFLECLDDETHDAVLRLCRILDTMLGQCCEGDARRTAWRRWLALAEESLPPTVFADLVCIGTPVEIAEHIAGLHLQAKAVQGRKPFQLPETN